MNTNQHYVSQALIRRFAGPDSRIEKYSLKYKKWKTTAPRSLFSELGYNQLLAFGEFNNDLDDRLKTLEDTLPHTLNTLRDAATRKETVLDAKIYDRFCWYCAFLWNMSPFAKAAAPINFIGQIMLDAKNGKDTLLKAIGMKETDIAVLQRKISEGYKIIITGRNYIQLVYRVQFARTIALTYSQYRMNTRWTLWNSPIEFPIADMALVQYNEQKAKAMLSVLPISPNLVLVGVLHMENLKASSETIVYGGTFSQSEAEYLRGVVCLSAIVTLAGHARIENINAIREKATISGIKFVKIQNLDLALSAGLTPIASQFDFLITPVTTPEYVEFAHSFIKP